MITYWRYFLSLLAFATLLGCENNIGEYDLGNNILTLSVSDSQLELNQRMNDREALTFSWSSGSNYNTGAAIYYSFEMDLKGTDYENGIKRYIGKTDSRFISFTHKELNDTLMYYWSLELEKEAEFEARIFANVANNAAPVQVSQTINFKITPYKERILDLYMIGDATPNGWDSQRATALNENFQEKGSFEWEGLLNKGELKFITTIGSFNPCFVRDGNDDNKMVYCEKEGAAPDLKFNVPYTAMHRIKLNIETLDITIENLDGKVPYNDIFIFGSAVSGTPIAMTQDSSDPFRFIYNGNLKAGRFQLATNSTASNCAIYQPISDAPTLSASSVELIEAGESANKAWELTADNKYTVTFDMRSKLLSISQFVAYSNIWMIGDATPGGWSWDKVTPFTQNPDNLNEFIYDGELSVGELKFPLEVKDDWSGLFILAKTNNQPLTETGYIIANQPDNKWKINSAGNYKIIINLYDETIRFTQK